MTLARYIPGNVERGIVRNQSLNLGELPEPLRAHELLECQLTGTASEHFPKRGPNLISCTVTNAFFPDGVSHLDIKDSVLDEVRIIADFSLALITRSVLRDVRFTRAALRDTVILDCSFENVQFDECNLTFAVFKNTFFRDCTFRNCITNNKLFEHCVFERAQLEHTKIQEITILQNFGLESSRLLNVTILRPETLEELQPLDLKPANSLERVAAEFFAEGSLNYSQVLADAVRLHSNQRSAGNVLHILTAIEQFARFISLLYETDRVRAYFVVQLFWSLNHVRQTAATLGEQEIVQRLSAAEYRIRPVYERLLSLCQSELKIRLVIAERVTADELSVILAQSGVAARIVSFERYNSPSLATLIADMPSEAIALCMLYFCTKFRFEIDAYQPGTSLLQLSTQILDPGDDAEKEVSAREYALVAAINVPDLVFAKLEANITLDLLRKAGEAILEILTRGKR